MGTTLTGTTPQDTYDSLIKVTDNGPLSGTLKKLTDGLGNDSSLSLSTGAASLSGTLAVTGAATFSSAITSSGLASLGIGQTTELAYIGDRTTVNTRYIKFERASALSDIVNIQGVNGGVGNADIALQAGGGNVGIGTTSPSTKFVVSNGGAAGLEIEPTGLLQSYNRSTGVYQSINLDGSNILFRPSGTERARITSDGLTFNGDTAAANALDDYEEGTWTMGVSFDGASVGVTTSANTGTYTKIGRQVTVNGYLILTNKGSSVGIARITGLPFTIAFSDSNFSGAAFRLDAVTFANQFQGFGVINATSIELEEITEAGTRTKITNADFANNSSIMVSLTYFV
jgi:hypothetical protein